MKTYFTLAALIAAMLALGACSAAPQPSAGADSVVTAGQTAPEMATLEIGWTARGPYGRTVGAIAHVESDSFSVPRLVERGGHGTSFATALFHTNRPAKLLVIGTTGRATVVTWHAGPRGHGPLHSTVEQLSEPAAILVGAGWHRLSVFCESDDACSDITATIDGKLLVPFEWR